MKLENIEVGEWYWFYCDYNEVGEQGRAMVGQVGNITTGKGCVIFYKVIYPDGGPSGWPRERTIAIEPGDVIRRADAEGASVTLPLVM